MKLGKYVLEQPVFMAPMAGITDKAFREIIQSLGGRYTVTEMISDKALLYNNAKTLGMLDLSGEPEPKIVQLFGSDPKIMAEAAQRIEAKNADVIDINMGCPTPKIVKNGEGAALLQDRPHAVKIAARIVESVNIPVTVKMRLGWDQPEITAPRFARELEDAGVQMISVHGRTREQFYTGTANWDWIKIIKESTSIPVIGNGDIDSPGKALEMMKKTGCDGVMIGRGALGNPWLISRTQMFLDTGQMIAEPDHGQKKQVLLRHLDLILKYKGKDIGSKEIRKHLVWYLKNMKNAAYYKNQIMNSGNPQRLIQIIEEIFSE